MQTHAKVLGILNIVSGILGLGAALVVSVVFGGVAAVIRAENDPDIALPIIGLTGIAVVLFILVTSIPSIIVGYGLYQLRPWSRVAGIVLSIISLILIPFGTLLGAYGLWVLFSSEGKRLFEPVQTS